MSSPAPAHSRLAYIDWMRGLACVLMFQTHSYDSWLSPQARQSRFFMYSQLGGTFPAPLFLFLAGISFALVTEKLIRKNLPTPQIAATTIRRGAEIFAFGLLFRLQEYLIAWGWAPKSDLLRVDILNTIGLSMMLMGVLCWFVLSLFRNRSTAASPQREIPATPLLSDVARSDDFPRTFLILASACAALAISLVTPLLWTTWRPLFLHWPLESYINGVHNLGTPQSWLFPVFPWSGFAFAGLAIGFLLQSRRIRPAALFSSFAICGVLLVETGRWLDARQLQLYPVYDFWHTSPNFFLIRLGMLLVILAFGYAWCRWGLALRGFSPLIQLGQASLLVYWVHIEFVYGRFSILPKRSLGVGSASIGLLIITLSMLLLAYLRTHATRWTNRTGFIQSFRRRLSVANPSA